MNCTIYAIFIQHLAATIWFFAFNAQTFREYAESFFYICYAMQLSSWYTLNFLNRVKYEQFFKELDGIIAQSKYD